MGACGVLQFEVLEQRLLSEYNCQVRRHSMPYTEIRRIMNAPDDPVMSKLKIGSDIARVEDVRGRQFLLFPSEWSCNWTAERNPDLKLALFGNDMGK